ncbi:hypothetical protein PMAYCL1PPCAC_14768, partial [Pristionchus mayeri]
WTYTSQACQQSCLQRHAHDRCSCADPLFLKAPEHKTCASQAEMECLLTLARETSRPNSTEGRTQCECSPACEEVVLEKVVSYTAFPSVGYNVAAGTMAQRQKLLAEQGGGRTGKGDDKADEYEATTTTSTTTTTTTTGSTSTTTPGSSGRKKRSALAGASTTVDLPGFGSCEYKNKNFQGAG